MRHSFAAVLLTALILLPASSWAADDTTPQNQDSQQSSQSGDDPQSMLAQAAANETGSGWVFGGGLAVTDPGYVGYNRQYTPFPLIFYHYGRFFVAGVSAGYLLSNGDHYRFALTVSPTFNRLKASDSPQLAGIETRQWSLAGGAGLELFGDWGRVNMGVSHDLLDRNNGTGANLGYAYSFHFGAGWSLTPGIGLRWESANLVNYYYGVSQAEAIPGRPAYSPDASTNPYVSLGLGTYLAKNLQLRADLSYTRFGSAIHDSPIVDRSGSPTLFIGVVYFFHPDKSDSN